MSAPLTYSRSYTLTAGETNAAGRMPVTLIVSRVIEIATLHANALEIGYSELSRHRLGWVLARIAVDIHAYPAINEEYTLTTWMEGYNKFFSDRCCEITDNSGRVLASVRTMWVAIDTATRAMADLSQLGDSFPVADRRSSVERCRPPRLAPGAVTETAEYTFRYTDIDFNGHVNTVRYIEAVLNTRTPDFYAARDITRLEAAFDRECHFGDTVALVSGASARNPEAVTTLIQQPDGRTAVAVELIFRDLS